MYEKPKFKKNDLITINNGVSNPYINFNDTKNKTIYKIKDVCSGLNNYLHDNYHYYTIYQKNNLIYSTYIIDEQYTLYKRYYKLKKLINKINEK